MQNIIDFIFANWAEISAFVLWVAVRLIPTKKNYDVVEFVVKTIGKFIPNNKVDSLGNPVK